MNWTLPPGLLALPLLLAGTPALAQRPVEAGIALRMDLDELVERAGLILAGRVLAARAVQDAGGRIDTEYTLGVDRTFWGEDLGQRVVRMPGGMLPSGRGMMIPGMARLAPGEEVVLLLSEQGASGLRVPVGLAQGKFEIVTDRHGARVALRSQAGLELLRPASGEVRPAEQTEALDYAELVARLEAAVAAKRARLESR